jgi:hypothetical protein
VLVLLNQPVQQFRIAFLQSDGKGACVVGHGAREQQRSPGSR